MSKINKLLAGASALATTGALFVPFVANAAVQCETGVTCQESDDFTTTINVADVPSRRVQIYF